MIREIEDKNCLVTNEWKPRPPRVIGKVDMVREKFLLILILRSKVWKRDRKMLSIGWRPKNGAMYCKEGYQKAE